MKGSSFKTYTVDRYLLLGSYLSAVVTASVGGILFLGCPTDLLYSMTFPLLWHHDCNLAQMSICTQGWTDQKYRVDANTQKIRRHLLFSCTVSTIYTTLFFWYCDNPTVRCIQPFKFCTNVCMLHAESRDPVSICEQQPCMLMDQQKCLSVDLDLQYKWQSISCSSKVFLNLLLWKHTHVISEFSDG